jgi:uncharacterized protein with PIN domain
MAYIDDGFLPKDPKKEVRATCPICKRQSYTHTTITVDVVQEQEKETLGNLVRPKLVECWKCEQCGAVTLKQEDFEQLAQNCHGDKDSHTGVGMMA